MARGELYIPEIVPDLSSEPEQALTLLKEYLRREFDRIAFAFNNINYVELKTSHAAPERPRDGMIIIADGVDWDPGSGAGFYGYRNGAWRLLE